MKPSFKNKEENKGGLLEVKHEGIYVFSYNDDYPTRIEIDPDNITSFRPYKIGFAFFYSQFKYYCIKNIG